MPSGGYKGIPKLADKYILSSVLSVSSKIFSRMDVPEKRPENNLSSCFQCKGVTALLCGRDHIHLRGGHFYLRDLFLNHYRLAQLNFLVHDSVNIYDRK